MTLEVKMKKCKQWETPQIDFVSRSKSGNAAGSYRKREDLYCVGPTPPAPADIGSYRKREDLYCVGPTPPASSDIRSYRQREDQYCVGPTPPDFELKL